MEDRDVAPAARAAGATRSHRRGRAVAAAGLLAAVAVAATACGSSTNNSSNANAAGTTKAGSGSGGAPLANMLPANVKSSGTISDASAFNYPPYAYTDNSGKYVGGEIDMLDQIAPLLGVKFKYQRMTEFSALVPAVGNGRVQMASESVGVTAERRKQVSYVEYGVTGEGLLVKKGNPSGISPSDPCGHSVAVEAGAVEVQFYQDLSKKCTSQGKKAINVAVYATEPAQVLAVENGHADAVGVGSTTVGSIASKSNGALEALPGLVPGGDLPLGFVFNPSEVQLAKAFEAALKQLQSDGTLDRINKKWNLVTTLHVEYLPATS